MLRGLGTWNGVLVLNYHRIGSADGTARDPDLWSAQAGELDDQVGFLAEHFDLIRPDQIQDVLTQRERAVMLTFDDGYRDNYDVALPILQKHAVPAVFFIATGLLDEPRLSWWDEIAWMTAHAPAGASGVSRVRELTSLYKSLGAADAREHLLDRIATETGSGRAPEGLGRDEWMTWPMVRSLEAAGLSVGGHSHTHPVLARLSPAEQQYEIETCARRIREELGHSMRWFSYPVGLRDSFDPHTRELVGQSGAELAFSFYGGHVRPSRFDPYDVPRTPVHRESSAQRFRAAAAAPALFARP
jgi:peptidoglycan/xylan/chitin deacetylase (PgdA/CDA1 family)